MFFTIVGTVYLAGVLSLTAQASMVLTESKVLVSRPNSPSITLIEGMDNAKALSIYMRDTMYYFSDQAPLDYFDYFQTPEVLSFSRHGDCDDFAIYSKAMLHKLGYSAQTYYVSYVRPTDTGFESVEHAITVFLDGQYYSVFSNKEILATFERSPILAIKALYPTWKTIAILEPVKYGYVTYSEFIDSLKNSIYAPKEKDTKDTKVLNTKSR